MAGLEGGTHDPHIARAIKRIIASAVRHFDQRILNALTAELGRVYKMGRAEPLGPCLLPIVDIHHNNLLSLVLDRSLNHAEPDTAGPKNRHVRPLFNLGRHHRRAVPRGNSATEQTGPVHGCLVGDSHNADVSHHGVLGEGTRAHEVQEVLALGSKTRSAIRHDAAALGDADLAAKIGLARLAEFTFATFGDADHRSETVG